MLYRGISIGTLLAGVGLAVVGVVLGFGGALSAILADPLNPQGAVDASNPTVTIAFAVLGLLVWQFGKSFALYHTLPRATGEVAAEEFDTERVRSEVLEVLDERLAGIEDELEETRRSVQELKRAEHAATFDESDHLETSSETSGAASGNSRWDGSSFSPAETTARTSTGGESSEATRPSPDSTDEERSGGSGGEGDGVDRDDPSP